MKIKGEVKPSKMSGLVGVIAGTFMLVFGVGFLIVLIPELNFHDGSGPLTILFFICWIGIVSLIIFTSAKFYRNKSAESVMDINVEGDDIIKTQENDIESKFRTLEKLRDEHLITEEEYQLKRKEILESKW